jgi:glycosyl transferase family 2
MSVLAGLARVKNEADVIEAFVRHHVALLDHLVVVDNASTDGTRQILAALVNERLPLTVLDDATIAYRQSELMTYLTRACCVSLGCDRVFLLDADELLGVHTREDLDAALALIPYESHALLAWRTYVPTACDDAAEPEAFRRIVHRRVAEPFLTSKVAVSRTILRRPDAIVVQGNHAVGSWSPDCSSAPLTGAFIAHFPVRSIAQLKLKILAGWNAYLAMGYESAGLGYQWRELYERMYSGGTFSEADLYASAASYQMPQPVEHPFELVVDAFEVPAARYATLRVSDPDVIAARLLEQLSRAVAAAASDATRAMRSLHAIEPELLCPVDGSTTTNESRGTRTSPPTDCAD